MIYTTMLRIRLRKALAREGMKQWQFCRGAGLTEQQVATFLNGLNDGRSGRGREAIAKIEAELERIDPFGGEPLRGRTFTPQDVERRMRMFGEFFESHRPSRSVA